LTPLGKRRELEHRREFQRKGSCLQRTMLLLAGLGLLALLPWLAVAVA
jgi:hypothetical protein